MSLHKKQKGSVYVCLRAGTHRLEHTHIQARTHGLTSTDKTSNQFFKLGLVLSVTTKKKIN